MLCVKLVFRFVFILFFRTYVWNISVACSVTYITDVVHRPIVWCSLTVHFLCHTHARARARVFNGPFFRDYPGEPVPERWKPIWILLKQEIVSGSGISWAMCKSAPRSRQITIPAPTTQFFTGRVPFLLPSQQCRSTEGRLFYVIYHEKVRMSVFSLSLLHSTLVVIM